MDRNQDKHRLSIADMITLLRIAGTILLLFFPALSPAFFLLYALTGLTDVLDGWIARRTKTASDFGARLDSVADLLFYMVMLLKIFPVLWDILPVPIWFFVVVIVVVRLAAYLTAAVKYHRFASLHTYLNKLTGVAVFLVPFLLLSNYGILFCWIVGVVAMVASLEELIIHIQKPEYCANTKSILSKTG